MFLPFIRFLSLFPAPPSNLDNLNKANMSYQTTLRTSSYSRLMKLTTMVRIRWLGIICQSVVVLFVGLYLQFPMPLGTCLAITALAAMVNIFLPFYYPRQHRLNPISTTLILGGDILFLALLLFLTGGLQNPFALLLVAPALLCAGSLTVGYIVLLNLLVIFAATLLAFVHFPFPWYKDILVPNLILYGTWTAIVSTLLYTTAYSYRIAEEARQLGDALTAMELALQHEQHLSALDGLAAAAAHELGTPLATIQLVARELSHQMDHDPTQREDMELLISQSQRCRDILQRLTSLSADGDPNLSQFQLTSALEEVIAPHRDFDIDIISNNRGVRDGEPIIARNPGLLHGLGNLIENAVDFAKSRVLVDYQWTDDKIIIIITDDGEGFPASILGQVGEPYRSARERNASKNDKGKIVTGGGLGLGLFIAKTLLERSGATISFTNSKVKDLGATITIVWPREILEI